MKLDHFFDGKKILFIGPRTFGYEREITARLEQLGATVEYYDDRPSAKATIKAAIRLFPQLVRRQIRSYFDAILENVQNDFDFVFIIKLECMPLDILEKLRQKLVRACFIYYSWDSVRNNPNFMGAAKYFDRLFTFDTEDARADSCLKLRPLFFLNEYRDLPPSPAQYDLCFVGTVHSDRFALIKKVKKLLESGGVRTKFYMFVPHKLIYWVNRVFSRGFWGSKPSDFAFEPLKKGDLLQMIAQSRAILDIQHPGQTGLTMRTIEMLGARKKLITTNPLVSSYDFFRPENILVIDRNNPVIDTGFLDVSYVNLPVDLYERYSLDGWIREVFPVPPQIVE
jgi:hypothetical protein